MFEDSVRELCKADYDEHTIKLWIESKPPESRTEAITKRRIWVAEASNMIAGFITIGPTHSPPEILALFVHPQYAGIGLGQTLLELGVSYITAAATAPIKIEATLSAVEFYTRIGATTVSQDMYSHDSVGLKLPVVNMVLNG